MRSSCTLRIIQVWRIWRTFCTPSVPLVTYSTMINLENKILLENSSDLIEYGELAEIDQGTGEGP